MILLLIKAIRVHCQQFENRKLLLFLIQGNVNTSPRKVSHVLVPAHSGAFSADSPPHCFPLPSFCDYSHVLLQAFEP